MLSALHQLGTWVGLAPVKEVNTSSCLYDVRLNSPGELTDHILSTLLQQLTQRQIDNVALRTARHIRTLPAPSEFMMKEEDFLNYAFQTKFLIEALKPQIDHIPDLKLLVASYETSLLANYKIYAMPRRHRGHIRDVIVDGVRALGKHPASFLNIIALTPYHLFNMRLMRNARALDEQALAAKYWLVDMLDGQVSIFHVYDYILDGIKDIKGVDVAILNRGSKWMQAKTNKALFTYNGEREIEITPQTQLPDQTMGNCVTVNTSFGLVDALTEFGVDLAEKTKQDFLDLHGKQELLEKNNEALADCVVSALSIAEMVSPSVRREIAETDVVYRASKEIQEEARLPDVSMLGNYSVATYPILERSKEFSQWPTETQELVRLVSRLGALLKAEALDVDDPSIEALIDMTPDDKFAIQELRLLVANYVVKHVSKLSFRSASDEEKQLKYKRAIALQKKARRLNPEKGNIVNKLGRLYESSGDLKSAKECLSIALELDPNNSIFSADLARVESAMTSLEPSTVSDNNVETKHALQFKV